MPGHNVVKVYNAEHAVKRTFNDINYKLYSSAWKSQFLSGLMMPLMTFIGNLGYVAVCVVGAGAARQQSHRRFRRHYCLYTVRAALYVPLSQLAQALTSMQTAAAASERVFEFLGEEELSDESGKKMYLSPASVSGEVSFEHVRFGYDPGKTHHPRFFRGGARGAEDRHRRPRPAPARRRWSTCSCASMS